MPNYQKAANQLFKQVEIKPHLDNSTKTFKIYSDQGQPFAVVNNCKRQQIYPPMSLTDQQREEMTNLKSRLDKMRDEVLGFKQKETIKRTTINSISQEVNQHLKQQQPVKPKEKQQINYPPVQQPAVKSTQQLTQERHDDPLMNKTKLAGEYTNYPNSFQPNADPRALFGQHTTTDTFHKPIANVEQYKVINYRTIFTAPPAVQEPSHYNFWMTTTQQFYGKGDNQLYKLKYGK